MLLQNISLHAQYPLRRRGGTLTGTDPLPHRSILGLNAVSLLSPHASGAGWESTASFPTGWQFGNGWMPAQSSNGAWRANLGPASSTGTGTVVAPNLAGGLNALAELTGSGTITEAALGLILYAVAALSGSGSLSGDADAKAALSAALSGSGDMDGTGQLITILEAIASLSGSGTLSAQIGAKAGLIAALLGSGGAAGTSTLTGKGSMSALLVVTGELLNSANVGSAVWNALSVANNAAGTMGEKLNDAGSASNPWTEVLESGYTAAEILRLIAAATQGNASGLEGGTPTFKGLNGTTVRIEATYVDGERTITDRDAS